MSERTSLRIRSLTIDRMYGMRMGIVVDEFSDGLNVVFGPNAAGKTTLVRAVEALLWEESPHGDNAVVEAELDIDGTHWSVTRQSDLVQWQREGVPHAPPGLPPADQRDRYRLLLPELLDAEGRGLADVVRLEAVGGIDIDLAREELGFSRTSPQSRAVSRSAEEKADRLRKIVDEQKDLSHDKETLRHRERERERLRVSNSRHEYLKRLLEYLDEAAKLDSSSRNLADFPEDMDRLQGDELEIIDRQRLFRKEASRKLAAAEKTAAEARQRIEQNRIPNEGLDDGVMDRLERRVSGISEAARRIKDAETSLAEEQKRGDRLFQDIRAVIEPETARSIDISGVAKLAKWARDAEKVRNHRLAADEILGFLGEEPYGPDPDTLSGAASALRSWLSAEGAGSSRSIRTSRIILAVSALATLLTALIVGILVHPAALVFILAALAQGWVAWRLDRELAAADSERHRREFESTGVEPPDGWTVEAVNNRLRELNREISDARWSEMRAAKRADVERTLEDTSTLDELAELRQRLVDETGIGPDATEEEIVYLVERIGTWREAAAAVDGTAEKVRKMRVGMEESLSELPDLVPGVDVKLPESAADAQEILISIRSARDVHAEASAKLRQAELELSTQQSAIETAEDEIARVYKRAGLEHGEEDRLRERLGRLDAYKLTLKRHQGLKGSAETCLTRVSESNHFEQKDLDADPEEVHRSAEEAAADAERLKELDKEITEIRTLIRKAEEGRSLESARADLEAALLEVRDYRMSILRSHAGSIVTEYVENRTRDQQLPDVLILARKKFQAIAPRYRLEWDSESANFAAYDRIRDKHMGLDSLSAGTRVQLLLSVRLAFIEKQEQGFRLPITLDETLANSDDAKANEIMEAILEICRSDRQVFYCTAQMDEVAKWKGAVDIVGDSMSSFHEIKESQDTGRHPVARFEPEARAVFRPTPPEPGEAGHAEYGRILDVPAWTPYDPIESAHSWFIVDDPESLHRLLKARFEFWGSTREFLVQGSGTAVGLSSADVDRILVLGDAATAWHESWKEGKGRPVDAIAIGECPAVSDTFRERVVDLCNEVGGDGRELVERLHAGDVKRFHSTKADELNEWLIDEGYVDTGDPLTDEQIWSRMIRRVSDRMNSAGVSFDDLDRLRLRLTPSRTEAPSEG